MSDPIQLVPNKPDKELADELKAELIAACNPWLEACTKAQKAGFAVQAQFGTDWYGRVVILSLSLSKHF